MKVLVTGAQGQLGSDVCRLLRDKGIGHLGVDHASLDLCDRVEIERMLYDYSPDRVIHCAAYTNVDQAQTDIYRCMAVNHLATSAIAEICQALGSSMVYISTDYVFDGMKQSPYTTEDQTNPLSVYGASKLLGEIAVREIVEKHYILRTSWLYGENGDNFVKTILRLANERPNIEVVNDQIGAPTYTKDLAMAVVRLAPPIPYGTYHLTNAGACSWAEFAQEIFRVKQIQTCKIIPIASECYPSKAARPKNSRLDMNGLLNVGIQPLPEWHDAIKGYLTRYRE